MQTEIVEAIRGKRLIEVTYEGELRIAEPHVLGERGKQMSVQLQVFQLKNNAAPWARPGWRYYILAKLDRVRVLQETFPGRRPSGSYQHALWSWIIEMVAS
jgi:hypothetical protein